MTGLRNLFLQDSLDKFTLSCGVPDFDNYFVDKKVTGMIEITGEPLSGKSLLSLRLLSSLQKRSDLCAYITCDNDYDLYWSKVNGVDNRKLLLVTPKDNDLFNQIKSLVRNGIKVIVIDSFSVAVNNAQQDIPYGQLTEEYQKLQSFLVQMNALLICVTGLRGNNKGVSTGGKLLKSLYSVRFRTHISGSKVRKRKFWYYNMYLKIKSNEFLINEELKLKVKYDK